jgi:hypothetical protein
VITVGHDRGIGYGFRAPTIHSGAQFADMRRALARRSHERKELRTWVQLAWVPNKNSQREQAPDTLEKQESH